MSKEIKIKKQLDFSTLKINEIKQIISEVKDRALKEELINGMISDISIFINEIQAKEKFHYELMYLESRALNGEYWDKKECLTDVEAREQNLMKVIDEKKLRDGLTTNSYSFNHFGVKLLYYAYFLDGQRYKNQHSLFIDNTYFDKFYTKEVEPQIKRLNGIKEYLKAEIGLIQTSEQSNPEPKQEKTKRVKPLKKFEFIATYESIGRIFQLLIKAGFINPLNGNIAGAIIRDTIKKYNEKTEKYENIDNITFNVNINKIRGKKLIKDVNKTPINPRTNSDYSKFKSLQTELNKIIL